jgi:exo-beta-1,3-glucanase (GH17 family)
MNKTFASAVRFMARLAGIGACLSLAACSETETGQSSDVSIGGTVSGLDGTVILQNNGMDDLTLSADGPFTFGLPIARGETYSVTVQTQPADQTCVVSDGSGTAETDVSTVSVVCTPNVTIGGTISGLTGGTVTLVNNGGNPLSTDANGPFAFSSTVPNGASYEVTVQTRPVGQTCLVTNGSGTATDDVTDVTVECADLELGLLPEIYATGRAINYSAYRAAGPEFGEMPSDADILEDLGLLQSLNYDLLRLFGGDAVSERILQLAEANFPEMRFQQGLFLEGLAGDAATNCDSALNDSQVETAVRLANTYSNVVTVSVGNETSFFSAFMPLNCLEGYITTTRAGVTLPITADDDYTFYAGFTAGRAPDTVLPLLDFVSIHMYPITNYRQWDWKQEGLLAGPLRAEAMMNAALATAQDNYQAVYDYEYEDASGATVTIGESLPIVVGETGWKWRQTTSTQEIETYAALPVNAKWYNDLTLTWERSPGGPVTIFPFVAFDEAWKTTDDGWGFWDELRMPNYVLCGTPAGSACNDPLYEGAGYYSP